MKITKASNDMSVRYLKFEDAAIGDMLSYDSEFGLYLKVGDEWLYDLFNNRAFKFDPSTLNRFIRRDCEIIVKDQFMCCP